MKLTNRTVCSLVLCLGIILFNGWYCMEDESNKGNYSRWNRVVFVEFSGRLIDAKFHPSSGWELRFLDGVIFACQNVPLEGYWKIGETYTRYHKNEPLGDTWWERGKPKEEK